MNGSPTTHAAPTSPTPASISNPLLLAALEYARRGWPVLPLHTPRSDGCSCTNPACEHPGKHPRTRHGLKDASLEEAKIRSWWKKWSDANIGIALPDDVVVVDVDGEEGREALRAAGHVLPETVTSKTGRGHHYFFRTETPVAPKVGVLPHVDLRGPGSYVVAVPSMHVSRKLYEWIGSPGSTVLANAPAWLLSLGKMNGNGTKPPLDTAAILEGVPEGQRDDRIFRLACKLRQAGVPQETAERLVLEAAASAKPPFPAKKAREKVLRAYTRYQTANSGEDLRPEIRITTEQTAVVDAAEQSLIDAGVGIYTRGRVLVEVSRQARRLPWLSRPAGGPTIIPIADARLRELMAGAARWTSPRRKSGRKGHAPTKAAPEYDLALPPPWAVATLSARPNWKFPEISLVTETPLLAPDGRIISHPGYDADTGVLFIARDIAFPPIPEHPTLDDARKAMEALKDPLQDFPFVGDSDRSASVAAMMTPLARPGFQGPAPGYKIGASVQGTGKTLHADVISIIATGRAAPKMPKPTDEAEASKRILAIAIEAIPLVVIDNVTGLLDSAVFAAALTATEWQDRLLGRNQIVTAPLTTMWILTANNPVFSSDMARRIIPIDMDAHLEDPESRTSFKYLDLCAHVETVRPQLVIAALTVLSAFHLAGHPGHGKPPMGSFEGWDALIRAALIWVGEADPLEGRERIRAQADVELEGLRESLTAWSAVFGNDAVTAAKAVQRAEEDGDLLSALANLAGCPAGKLDARKLGYALRRVSGRIVNGMLFGRETGNTRGAVRWLVRQS